MPRQVETLRSEKSFGGVVRCKGCVLPIQDRLEQEAGLRRVLELGQVCSALPSRYRAKRNPIGGYARYWMCVAKCHKHVNVFQD
jgi:hypothetical protein